MPHLSARDVSRTALNPRCQVLAALPLLALREQEAFHLLTGRLYPGPRGERTAAFAWGRLFEARLTERNATRLLAALDATLGIRPEHAWIRDLRQEVPDREDDAVATRAARTRLILQDLLAGLSVPDLILQPALVLRRDGVDWGSIVPDALVLDRIRGAYCPLETKAYIALDGIITPGERAVLRLQAAVEIVALHAELTGLDPAVTIPPQALLVVASPFGVRPQPAVLENLQAEMAAVETALTTLARVLARLAVHQPAPLRDTLVHLPFHFQESCRLHCALAGVCRTRAPHIRATFCDHVAALLGKHIDLASLIALVSGERPTTPEEAALQEAFAETAVLYHWR